MTTHVAPGVDGTVLSPDEATALGRRILEMTSAEFVAVGITHTVRGITRIANGRVLGGLDGEELSVALNVRTGKRPPVHMYLDQRDDTSLRRAVAEAEMLAARQVGNPVDLETLPFGPQEYPTVHLWNGATATALDTARHAVIAPMINTVSGAGLDGAGFVGGIARTIAFLRKDGLVAVGRETDVECTVTARARDGTASGWAGAASRDWSRIDPVAIAVRAANICRRASHPVAFEPGRRKAILTPAAVAWLVRWMGWAFDALEVSTGGSPLSKGGPGGGSKLGLRVIDSRLDFTSDPGDVETGYMPFYDSGETAGLPMTRITWIERGVLRSLAYQVGDALLKGRQHHDAPSAVRVEPSPGVQTMTLDQMVANCDEGILVNRLSGIQMVDRQSGMLSGYTRDGCFLIRNGTIEKSLKNFRVLVSPFQMLNAVDAVGVPERPAVGHVESSWWPMPPVVAPALMVRDFNFAGLSDAV